MPGLDTSTSASGRPSNSLHYAVGEISGKLDQVIAQLVPQLASIETNHGVLSLRVDTLEKWQSRIMGAGGIIIIVLSSVEVIRLVIRT